MTTLQLTCTHCGAACECEEYFAVYECTKCGKMSERPQEPSPFDSATLTKLFLLAKAHIEQHGDGEITLPDDAVN